MEERAEELRIGRDGVIARGPRSMEIAREVERRRQWKSLAVVVIVALIGLRVDATRVATVLARMAAAW